MTTFKALAALYLLVVIVISCFFINKDTKYQERAKKVFDKNQKEYSEMVDRWQAVDFKNKETIKSLFTTIEAYKIIISDCGK
jgi:hypothetical protein